MGWKILIAALLAVLMLFLLGEHIEVMNWLKGAYDWLVLKFKPHSEVLLKAELQLASLQEQAIKFTNSSLQSKGKCLSVKMNGVKIGLKGKECELRSEQASGELEFKQNLISLKFQTKSVELNELAYAAEPLQVMVELEVNRLSLKQVQADLKLSNATGVIHKLRDGEVDVSKWLKAEKVELKGFVGQILLTGSNITLEGKASLARMGGFELR